MLSFLFIEAFERAIFIISTNLWHKHLWHSFTEIYSFPFTINVFPQIFNNCALLNAFLLLLSFPLSQRLHKLGCLSCKWDVYGISRRVSYAYGMEIRDWWVGAYFHTDDADWLFALKSPLLWQIHELDKSVSLSFQEIRCALVGYYTHIFVIVAISGLLRKMCRPYQAHPVKE